MGQDYEVSFQKIFCFHNPDFQETLPSDTAGVRPGTTGLALMVVSYIDMMIQVQRGSSCHMFQLSRCRTRTPAALR